MNFLKNIYVKAKIVFMWTLAVSFCISLIAGIIFAVINYNKTNIFDLKKVIVRNENLLEASQVIGISKIKKGIRIMDIDRSSAVKKLNDSPYIESSRITLVYPATIIIDIKETEPIAFVKNEAELFYVDREGKILCKVKPRSGYDLPIINSGVSAEIVEFLNISLEKSPLMYHQISEAEYTEKGIELYLNKSSTRIIIGKEDFRKKIVVLENFLKEEYNSIPFGKVDYIDLRFDDQVVLRELKLADKQYGEM